MKTCKESSFQIIETPKTNVDTFINFTLINPLMPIVTNNQAAFGRAIN